MFFIQLSLNIALKHGERTKYTYTNTPLQYTIDSTVGYTCRFYLESLRSKLYLCNASDTNCEKPFTNIGSRQTTQFITDANMTTLHMNISSSSEDSGFITCHCAKEQQDVQYITGSGNQKVAFFNSLKVNIKLYTIINASQELNISGTFYSFDGKDQTPKPITDVTVTFNNTIDLVEEQDKAGWLILDITPKNPADIYKITIQQSIASIVVGLKLEVNMFPFAESKFIQYLKRTKQTQVSIAAFSNSPEYDGNLRINAFTYTDLQEVEESFSSILGFKVDAEAEYLVLFQFKKINFMIEKDQTYYDLSQSSFNIIAQEQVGSVTKFPISLPFDFKTSNTQKFAINTFSATSNQVMTNCPIAYAFSFNTINHVPKITASVGVNNLPNFGVSFQLDMFTMQSFVTQQSPYFVRGGMYFIEATSNSNESGNLLMEASYETGTDNEICISELNTFLNFHATTSEYSERKYSVCLEVDATSFPTLNKNSFKIEASNNLYLIGINPRSEQSVKTGSYYLINNMHYYCIDDQGDESKKYAHFRIEKIDKTAPDINGIFKIREQYYYQAQAFPNQLIEFEFDKNYQLTLTPPYYLIKKYQYIQKKLYIYFEITEADQKVTVSAFDSNFQFDTPSYKASVIDLSTLKKYQIQMSTGSNKKVKGRFYVGLHHNEPMSRTFPYQYNNLTTVFELDKHIATQPALLIQTIKFVPDLTLFEAYLCPNRPKLSRTMVVENCQTFKLENKEQSIAIPYDGDRAGETDFNQEKYFVTIFLLDNQPEQLQLQIEIIKILNVITNFPNPISILQDEQGAKFQNEDQVFQIFDLLLYNDQKQKSLLKIQLDKKALNWTLCKQPYSFESLKVRRGDLCEFMDAETDEIEHEIDFYGKQYKRVYLHIYGDAVTKQLSLLQVQLFQILEQQKQYQYQLSSKVIGRELFNEKVYQIKSDDIKSIQFVSASLEKSQSTLKVSKTHDFSDDYLEDSSDFIQVIQTSNSQFKYVKIVPKHFIEEDANMTFEYKINGTVSGSEILLNSQLQLSANQSKNAQFYMHNYKGPAYLQIELCSSNTQNHSLDVQMSQNLDPFQEPKKSFTQKRFYVPIDQKFENKNVFFGVSSKNEVEFEATPTFGSARPAIPVDSQLKIESDNQQITARFKASKIQKATDREFYGIKLDSAPALQNATVSYAIYAFENDSASKEETPCGLKYFLKVVDYVQIEEHDVITINFQFKTTLATMFIVTAKNDQTGEVSLYKAAPYVNLVTQNVAAIVGGSIGCAVALVIIIVLTILLIKFQQKNILKDKKGVKQQAKIASIMI